MKTDKNILQFLAGEAVAQSIVGGGIVDADVRMETYNDGLKIEISTPSLKFDNYKIELKNQFLQIYTFYGKSLLPSENNEAVRIPVLMKSVLLPPVVDLASIDAIFENGELHIFIPFKDKEDMQTKTIDIKRL